MSDQNVKVKIIKQTVANKKTVRVGDIVEVSASDARYLIGAKKAEAPKPKQAKE